MVVPALGMRLFFALNLPEAVRAEAATFQSRARTLLRGSWPPPANLHLTLAFLGEQPEDRLPVLRAVGGDVAAGHGAFELRTAGLGGFPRPSHARVLWLGLEAEPSLVALAGRLRKALGEVGIAVDAKPYAPHLTLARFAAPVDITACGAGPRPQAFTVDRLVLYRSHLGAQGARYEALGEFVL